jgi:hypothetical protein
MLLILVQMYVMQSLPSHQQALAGGIFNTIFRLGSAVSLGLSTAVYSSVAQTSAASVDPMLPYTRAFDVCIGLSAASFLFLPFVRLGTQGHSPDHELVPGNSVAAAERDPSKLEREASSQKP